MLLFLKQLGIAILIGVVLALIIILPLFLWLDKAAKRARQEWEEEQKNK